MNHLGDTNKMVETPRTETYVLNPLPQVVSAEWARQLECELNAANDRIKRLEEALTSIGEYWNRHNNERAMEEACWYAVYTAADALEAKEAKP